MPIDMGVVSQVQELYRAGSRVRPAALGEATARVFYKEYIQFVQAAVPRGARVLDVGCGAGWSSKLLSDASYDVCGTDLTDAALEVTAGPRLAFNVGNAMELPFEAASFDAVTTYQVLEHVPDPERALQEIHRVLRPGGIVCVVGPHLMSPLNSLRSVFRYAWRNRPWPTIFVRRPGMPRHPGGNTLPESVHALVRNTSSIVTKTLAREPRFVMRTPDHVPPFHADNDACYLCNPIDLWKFFSLRGYRVLHFGKPERPRWTAVIAGGTWFAAQKATA
jgi:SAM-dependent methyltransferase